MADTKISALTAGNPAQSADEIPINRGGANFKITAGSIASALAVPGGSNTHIQFNNGGVFGGEALLTWNTATDTFTVIGTSIIAGEVQQSANVLFWTGADNRGAFMLSVTADTPDTFKIMTGSLSNGIVICEGADRAFDFAHAQQTNPTLFIHSAAQSTTQWVSLTHDGTAARLDAGTGGVVVMPDLRGNSNIYSDGFFANVNGVETVGAGFYPSNANLTPDGGMIFVGSTSNSIHLNEAADRNFDFNNGLSTTNAVTNPAFIIHSAAQNVTEYNQLNFMGSHGGNRTTLTDNTATPFFHTPTLTAGQMYVGTGTYAVTVLDAANETQVVAGTFEWYAMRGNTGGTVGGIQQTGNDGVLPGLPLIAVSSGTLTVALTATVATDVVTFNMTANTSLTPTAFIMSSQVNVRIGPAEVIAD